MLGHVRNAQIFNDLSIGTLLSRKIFSLQSTVVVRDQCEMIRREMDNMEAGLSVKVIEEVDGPTGSCLSRDGQAKAWLAEN